MRRLSSGTAIRILLIVTVLAGAIGLQSAGRSTFTKLDKAFYADPNIVNFVRPGLVFKVVKASITSDGTITTEVLVTDPQGLPLDRKGINTPGVVAMTFIAATIPNGKKQYTSYTTRTVTSTDGKTTAIQAAGENTGTFTSSADGDYTYTFKTKAPAGFDASATHTVAVYGNRNLTTFDLGINYASATLNFVPTGAQVTVTRDVIRDSTCQKCHFNIGFHGGSRVGMELCVLCHTPQSVDPNTGNNVDLPLMIHEIHMGAAAPNAKAGKPYTIYGFNGPTDWHDVTFPGSGSINDPRNCQTCHEQNTGAAQATAYLTPNRAACGGCHDNVNFATGENHVNLPQVSDNQCANCHIPQGELPFDASIMGAHITPQQYSGLPGLVISILKVDNGTAGSAPTVTFTLKDSAGNPVLVSDLTTPPGRLAAIIAGPTSDYGYTVFGGPAYNTHGYVSEDATKATCGTDGTCTYQFIHTIPANATGTYSIGMEGRRGYTINANTEAAVTTEYGAVNKVFNFSVDGSPLVQRRKVVDISKCNACHQYLTVHGENRNQIEMCVLCHNPSETDAPTRGLASDPADKNGPPQAVNFALLVHKIHTGAALAASGQPYEIIAFGGTKVNFNDVTFPAFSPSGQVGNVQNCSMCHVNGSEANFPIGLNDVTTPQGYENPTPATTAACTACHATKPEFSHAVANTTQFGESCNVCHASGAQFDVDQVHAQ